jgi:hypothetical protein
MADDPTKPEVPASPALAAPEDIQRRMRDLLDQTAPPPRLPDAQLLRVVQHLIATMPPRATFAARAPEIATWVGPAAAVVERWNPMRAIYFRMSIENIGTALDINDREYSAALAILHEARFDVELRGETPTAAFVDQGKVHDYFVQVCELIAQPKSDLLIADRYLNSDFIARYMPFVTAGTHVRLLVRTPERTLVPAIGMAAEQFGLTIEVRAHSEVHDRYLFLDRTACYMSGASFADGGKTGPTAVVPVLGFAEVLAKYEAMWSAGGAQT